MKKQRSSQSAEDDLLHWVKASSRQRGYWRRKPWTYDLPKTGQRKARALFGKSAHREGTGRFGKAEIVDKNGQVKEVPASAVAIMEKMEPVTVPEPKKVPVSPVERLRRLREILARIAPST